MESRTLILIIYGALGLLLVLLNKKISDLNYKLILFYTNKLRLKDLFIFKVNNQNKNSMRLLTRFFTVTFGFMIFMISLYYIYN